MLKNLIELGRDVKTKFDNYNNWEELNFNAKDKVELERLDHVTAVFNNSIKFEFDSNHSIVPSQYILYALTIKDFALGLKEHLDVFDSYKINKNRNQIGDEITNRTFDREVIGLDEYSQSILMEPIINNDYNFNAKSIINGSEGDYKVRGSSDFFASVILKIINVPDASSAILGKLIYYLAARPDLYNYLESRFIDYLPYLVQDTKIKCFAKKTFAYLEKHDNLLSIKGLIVKNSDNSFSSIKLDDDSLTSIFKTSDTLLLEEDLKQGGKLRYFPDPLFHLENEFYYFSTEWTNGTDSRLDLESLKSIIALTYPQFEIKKDDSFYQLISSSIKINIPKIKQVNFSIQHFISDTQKSNLTYDSQLIGRYISSLATKPFVLLSGLSGSGKTKLAEAFAQWICESEDQYALIPVGADWTNREPLLGYPNALKDNEYVKPDNDALDLLIRAKEDKNRPYFLILDEMNLSHVERYFADFLSTMESKNTIPLHKMEEEVNNIPKQVKLPKNLFIVGTVNIDETTYMFSPKVLDRANTIEFRVSNTDISKYLESPKDIELEKLKGQGVSMATNFVEIATAKQKDVKGEEIIEDYKLNDGQEVINRFFIELQKSGAEFGYRTAFEISKLIYKLKEFGSTDDNDNLDIAIMQKMLPKLHGSRTKLTRTLKPLAKLCLKEVDEKFDKMYFENFEKIKFKEDTNIKYKLSFEKIMRMYKNAVENGFASYAEA